MLDVLIIGNGAIASELHKQLARSTNARAAALLVRPQALRESRAKFPAAVTVIASVGDIPEGIGIVVECAGHGAVVEYGEAILKRGLRLVISSIGALADDALRTRLTLCATQGKGKVVIPAGALAGLDALASARMGGLDHVRYTARKHPDRWPTATTANQVDTTRERVIYYGPARDAAKQYPQNANVAAAVALAGIGFERTEVTLIADPDAVANIHLIEARGTFGELRVEVRAYPIPTNPKTSLLAALSVMRAIENTSASVEI